jgi:hypothetical protein
MTGKNWRDFPRLCARHFACLQMVSSPERRQRFGLFGFDSRISPRSGFFLAPAHNAQD